LVEGFGSDEDSECHGILPVKERGIFGSDDHDGPGNQINRGHEKPEMRDPLKVVDVHVFLLNLIINRSSIVVDKKIGATKPVQIPSAKTYVECC
jgi:hypothetical protein